MTTSEMKVARLLVVSRDTTLLCPLRSVGESNGWQLDVAADPLEAIERVQAQESLDVIVMDVPQASSEGLHSLRWLRSLRPELPVILIGHASDNGKRQEGLRMGARDYLVRPIEYPHLENAIKRSLPMQVEAFEAEIASEDVEQVSEEGFFIGVSPIMQQIRAQAVLLAKVNEPVLILGEAGSGKETIARLVHKLSVRSGFGFAKVNCAALPGDLLERELFGCERKSATANECIRTGKLELCAKGTIFLDEITEMPVSLQATLMQVLNAGRFNRAGTSDSIEADVRVVAASSKIVERSSSGSRLAKEFYGRLSTYTIHVPPLRERPEELYLLSRHLMHRLARQYGLPPRELSPTMMESWRAYNWPGNLQELELAVKRYLVVGDQESAIGMRVSVAEDEAQRARLDAMRSVKQVALSPNQPGSGVRNPKSLRSFVKSAKAEVEKNAIAMALEKTGWNRKAAARLLEVSYRTVLYKIEEYRLSASDSSA